MTLGRTITLKDLTGGGQPAMAEALAVLESAPDAAQTISLLDAPYTPPPRRVIGVTGPPGLGKSTLLGAAIPRPIDAGTTQGGLTAQLTVSQTVDEACVYYMRSIWYTTYKTQ